MIFQVFPMWRDWTCVGYLGWERVYVPHVGGVSFVVGSGGHEQFEFLEHVVVRRTKEVLIDEIR